jgi:hypothetical protein
LPFVIATQNDANGAITEGLRGSLSIARLRVYDRPLTAQAISQIYNTESGKYTALMIQTIRYDAAAKTVTITWDATPGAQYEVQAATAATGSWTPAATNVTTGTFTDTPPGETRFLHRSSNPA